MKGSRLFIGAHLELIREVRRARAGTRGQFLQRYLPFNVGAHEV
jgi:hypothetical protein